MSPATRPKTLLAAALCLAAVLLAAPAPAAAEASGREILDRVDDLFRGDASHGEMEMTITTAHWRRTLAVEFWSRGQDQSLMRILAPKKEKGTATLRVGNEMWNYLPKVKRVIKLPSSMLSQLSVATLQLSIVHASPSSQLGGVPARQPCASSQISTPSQKTPLSQGFTPSRESQIEFSDSSVASEQPGSARSG